MGCTIKQTEDLLEILPVAELIIGAQEQALSIKSVEVGVYHTRQDQRCRLGKDAPETALSSRV